MECKRECECERERGQEAEAEAERKSEMTSNLSVYEYDENDNDYDHEDKDRDEDYEGKLLGQEKRSEEITPYLESSEKVGKEKPSIAAPPLSLSNGMTRVSSAVSLHEKSTPNNSIHQKHVAFSSVQELEQTGLSSPHVESKIIMKSMTLKLIEDDQSRSRRRSVVPDLARVMTRFPSIGASSWNNPEYDDGKNEYNYNPLSKYTENGEVKVSWFEGTSREELSSHVEASLSLKLSGRSIECFRLMTLNRNNSGLEEVVLSPHIPDGSSFYVYYKIAKSPRIVYRSATPAPDSPSAAPNSTPVFVADKRKELKNTRSLSLEDTSSNVVHVMPALSLDQHRIRQDGGKHQNKISNESPRSMATTVLTAMRNGDTPKVSGKIGDERVIVVTQTPQQEKTHVIFTLANYFVLFLSIITIATEIAERAPSWIESNIAQVNQCAVDKETMFECINEGNIAGVIAAFGLWTAKSKSTKRFFLLGFRSGDQLWTAIYEAFVGAFCWGFSYLFIRRGLNPDSRENLISRFWKDAVYGSLAGFNASFMKAVLKNLIPKEAIEEAVMESKQHLRFVDWLIKVGNDGRN